MDTLSLIENRLAKLENLVGEFKKIEDTKVKKLKKDE